MLTRRDALSAIGAVVSTPVWAQASPTPVPDFINAMYQGRYLPLCRLRGTPAAGPRQNTAQFLAYVGDEASALAGAANPRTQAIDLTGATAEDAVDAIVRQAKGRRIVMLNESHGASRHRLFLAQVARALQREGFTHLAAETFANHSDAPVLRLRKGDDFKPGYGTYTFDPVFAEAVREALALGYQLVPYEFRNDQRPAEGPISIAIREQAQADNFAAALARWPQGRFLVYVGYSHLLKTPDPGGNSWFAKRLMEKTALEPLTVEQSMAGSFGPHAADAPLATQVLQQFAPRRPIVVRLGDGSPLVAAVKADLTVFHPSAAEVDCRPGWLAADRGRRRRVVRLATPAKGLVLAQAIHGAESDPAIPADQFIVPEGATQLVFYLRPGRYRVRLETEGGFVPITEVTA